MSASNATCIRPANASVWPCFSSTVVEALRVFRPGTGSPPTTSVVPRAKSIVLTSGADYVRDIARRNPDMAEPVEVMAEAALELCSRRHVGLVAYSRRILHSLGLAVMSLDGKTVLGDAFVPADVESTV